MEICTCIRGDDGFFFHVEAIDRKTIIYQDLSDWMNEGQYVAPSEYQLDIIPPGKNKAVSFTIQTGAINKISYKDLGGCLIDGAYCFQTFHCGKLYTKTRALFPFLECCLKKAWATQEDPQKIRQVKEFLELADVNIELNNLKTGTSNLKTAKKLLDNIKCDCDCR